MQTFDLQAEDKLYAYSDGIIETANLSSEMFGQERLISCIAGMLSADKNIQQIEDDVAVFRGNKVKCNDLALVELSSSNGDNKKNINGKSPQNTGF
ncbi:MAG: hypothetical protein OFPI_02390 [Osedax symbiont Rs2]|nr:MAG: hypothetical protein OFPI_02390 [Osedax symbiont Rs2]